MKQANRGSLLFAFALSAAFCPSSTHAAPGLPAGAGQNPPAAAGEITLKATSANVKESGSPVKVRIIRWSTDEERNPVVAAMNPAPPAAAPARAAGGGGAAAAGRGGAAARGGRGGAGRGGRGDAAAPLSPIAALTAAIGKAPTVGYIWTTDITGYSIKYAFHSPMPDGGERIILATDRRLGAYTVGWKPAAATAAGAEGSAKAADTDYEFTLIEIRLDSKGSGEGKASLMTKVIVDENVAGAPGTKTIALDNYASTPAILQNVKR
jgi:hypothetical protein